MKAVHANTAKWQPVVLKEIAAMGLPFPPGLILAIIDVESNGVPGLVNASSGASGLMQVMPSALDWYNKSHALKFTMSDMRSKENGPAQIRVGTWLVGQFWRIAYAYLSKRLTEVPLEQLAKIADLMYAAGPGRIRNLMDKLPSATFEAFETAYPKSNALPHPRRVYDRVDLTTFSSDSILSWMQTSVQSSAPAEEKKNWLTAAVLIAIIGWIVSSLLKQYWDE